MKRRNGLLVCLLTLTFGAALASAHADTEVLRGHQFARAWINYPDAEVLYSHLDVPTHRTGKGTHKSYATSDGKFQIHCVEAVVPAGHSEPATQCLLSIEEAQGGSTEVTFNNEVARANTSNQRDSKSLYQSLTFPAVSDGYSRNKRFETQDQKVKIHCAFAIDLRPGYYSCSAQVNSR